MRDMDKNFELCQAISNYSLVLNLTLNGIIEQLDNIDESILDSMNPTITIGKHTIGGKTIMERFDALREEFNKISSLARQIAEVNNNVTKRNESSKIQRDIKEILRPHNDVLKSACNNICQNREDQFEVIRNINYILKSIDNYEAVLNDYFRELD